MKKTSLIVNIVLGIAIVTLYILHFTGTPKSTEPNTNNAELTEQMMGDKAIAWVNMDSLLNNYDLYFDIQQELEIKGRKMETDMTSRTRNFEKQMIDFQEKVQKGLVTRSTAQQMQEDLAAKEQELYQYRDELRMQFTEEEQVMLRRIQHSITDFLKSYNQDKGYQIIMSGSFGGPLLYGHPSIDVTKDVLKGLNAEYQKSRPSKK
ncbi:MAG TPA: OmpH family outer membrane protein [Perlabentimonas sp.]|nr:OmpH family outer membrane protein [Bacteroidales bacterium]MDD4671487.1 OmpH family outer membrane protein [Bacteroidales bacterium]MDY0348519.1 OmpH family outer membrane protein [Tenuifilaceae bacterium]HZJ74772.1 OmpH family outer membrane protein [Perlabentimonas sp.]